MGSIITNSRIDGYVDRLFKKGCVVLDNKNESERGVISSMVWRLKELRKSGSLTVGYDDRFKRTVFVLHGVRIDKRHRYNFGGRLLHYVLTGVDRWEK